MEETVLIDSKLHSMYISHEITQFNYTSMLGFSKDLINDWVNQLCCILTCSYNIVLSQIN